MADRDLGAAKQHLAHYQKGHEAKMQEISQLRNQALKHEEAIRVRHYLLDNSGQL